MFLGKTDIHRYMNMKLNKVRRRNAMGAKYPKVCKPFLKVCFDGRTPRGDLSEKNTSSSGHCLCPKCGGGRATLPNIFKIKFSQDGRTGHKA